MNAVCSSEGEAEWEAEGEVEGDGYQMGPVMGADLGYMDVLVRHCFGIQMGPVTGWHGLHIALPHNAA